MIDRITEQPFCQTRVMRSVLVNADSLDYMPTIQDKSIDFVCIDPPYELDNHGGVVNGHDLTRKLNRDKHINFISDGFDLNAVFSQIERVSKVMNMICFCSNKQVSKIMNYWEQKKYSVTLLVWDKPNPIPFGNGKHISNLEFMVYVRGKGATFNNLGVAEQKKTFNYPSPSSSKRLHPTEKPIELLERLIKLHTKEDDIVLDCFAGSFSTADACKRLNRKCIAIELEKEYYNKGVNRLSGSLF
jgi:site-specific DNA-methyltransferase (adenine-specific)